MKALLILGLLVLSIAAQVGAPEIVVKHQGIALDTNGNPVAGATIMVYLSGTTTMPPLYYDLDATVKAANPFLADFRGNYEFYIAPGLHDIHISGTGDEPTQGEALLLVVGLFALLCAWFVCLAVLWFYFRAWRSGRDSRRGTDE